VGISSAPMTDRTLYVLARLDTVFATQSEQARESDEARAVLADELAEAVRSIVPDAELEVRVYRGSICAVLMISIGTGLLTSAIYDAIKIAIQVILRRWALQLYGQRVPLNSVDVQVLTSASEMALPSSRRFEDSKWLALGFGAIGLLAQLTLCVVAIWLVARSG
jgi:hypothetical protein